MTPTERSDDGRGRRVFAGGHLESVLQEVERSEGAAADIVRVERSIVGGVAGFFGRERFEVEVAVLVDGEADVEVDTQVDTPVGVDGETDASSEPADPGSPVGPARPEDPSSGAAFARALHAALADAEPRPGAAAVTSPAPEVLPAYTVVSDPPPEIRPAVFERLDAAAGPDAADGPDAEAGLDAAAGHPGSVATLVLRAGDLPFEDLVQRVEAIAAPAPSLPPVGVLAVVGDGEEVIAAAEAAAVAAGGAPGDVLVVAPQPLPGRPSWMCLCSHDQAAARRAVWRDAERLVVVAVVVGPGELAQQWGRGALDALRADQTRLAVPGWRRPEEVASRLAAMAPVHAIELVDAVDAAAVVEFLELPVPVASIDGQPATHARWAELIVEAAGPATVGASSVGVGLGIDGSALSSIVAELGA